MYTYAQLSSDVIMCYCGAPSPQYLSLADAGHQRHMRTHGGACVLHTIRGQQQAEKHVIRKRVDVKEASGPQTVRPLIPPVEKHGAVAQCSRSDINRGGGQQSHQ